MAGIPPGIVSSALQAHQAARRAAAETRGNEEDRIRRAERLRRQIEEHSRQVERSDETDDQQARVRGDEHQDDGRKGRKQDTPNPNAPDATNDESHAIDIQA